MFFEGDRIDFVREMILSTKKSDRVAAVSKLLPYQKGTSKGIFQGAQRACRAPSAFWTRPCTNSFPDEGTAADLAQKIGMPVEVIMRRVSELP